MNFLGKDLAGGVWC